MMISKTDFGKKLKGLFSQARINLQKKENGKTDFNFTKKEYGFYIDDKIKVKTGLGQFGVPAFVPWMGFLGPHQTPQEGIYPVIACYLKQHTIILAYGVSATRSPLNNWIDILDKNKNTPTTIGKYFKSKGITVENPDYNDCYIYSIYSDELKDSDISDIYDDIYEILIIYRKNLGITPSFSTNPLKVTTTKQTKSPNTQNVFYIKSVINEILSTGLIYSDTIIKRFAYSLMAKPFVILSGLAGSGKTQLALAFAKCLSEDIEKQVCTVSIGADWTNREPLLGYPNALRNGEYVMPESGVLQLLMRADADPSRPYFLILDEMNLSVVERYFADFLSVMESGENIKLWEGEGDVPKEIALPKNVFIIGTINVDETTYMFSPKVLDRANVIEFKIAPDEMEKYLNEKKDIHLEVAYSACADMAVDFVNKAKAQIEIDNQSEKIILLSFFKELKKVNAEFGYRTINEICRYLYFAHKDENGLKDNNAIDTAILQKLLPKLHGSRKKLAPVLSSMWKLCLKDNKDNSIDSQINKDDFNYPESAEKIQRMYNAVVDNGFTSFAEA